ncbi:MAG: helix-turn-helix domain-containing protein [Acidobacteriota bacterium]|nr:helix-turn-helix domain-containing protein [Acidobacteriota bacterium]
MKKVASIKHNVSITRSSGNVFIDCGFEPAEAHTLLMRSTLMNQIEKHLSAQNWTQAEAAKQMGITQPRVSKLIKGAWDEFSLDMLVTLATRLGLKYELRLAA